MLELFPKIPPLKKISQFQDWKKTTELVKEKGNFKPEIKLMVENWQDELYQLENKRKWC